MQFKDKKNRLIELIHSNETIEAFCVDDDVTVGSIQFQVVCFGDEYTEEKVVAYPEIAHIDEAHQRSGIATKIIEYAKTIYDNVYFCPDRGYGGQNDYIHYSDAGLSFKNSCEKNHITDEMTI